MKIAIMQPYIFPYIGYFQLIYEADVFVFYDDVNFIKQGWINRNRILLEGKEYVFTLPLNNASSFNTIKETKVDRKNFNKWKIKFLKSLDYAYKKAPNYKEIYDLVHTVINTEFETISDYAIESIKRVTFYLDLKTKFYCSSIDFGSTKVLDRESRIIEISKLINANNYINPIGGEFLYEKDVFSLAGIQLNFLEPSPVDYQQFGTSFIPWLSIIDVLMFNSKDEIIKMLNQFDLV